MFFSPIPTPPLSLPAPISLTNLPPGYIRVRAAALAAAPGARVGVDASGNLVLANQQARTLFSLSPKDRGRSWQDIELFSPPLELPPLTEQAISNRQPVALRDV